MEGGGKQRGHTASFRSSFSEQTGIEKEEGFMISTLYLPALR